MKKVRNVVWIIGIFFTVIASFTYGLWFWVSKNSWISTSTAAAGVYIHCLDFKFEHTKISGAIVTRFEPFETRRLTHPDRNNFPLVLAAVSWEGEFYYDYWAHIDDELLAYKVISIFEGIPIVNHIPDMDVKDKDGILFGTVSFTLWPGKIMTWPDRMSADFKSTKDMSIKLKEYYRSDKKTEDERCIVD